MSYDRFRLAVSLHIKKARKKAGLTQEDMQKFGFNLRHYQDLEGGKVRFTLETLYRLSQALRISPNRLVKF